MSLSFYYSATVTKSIMCSTLPSRAASKSAKLLTRDNSFFHPKPMSLGFWFGKPNRANMPVFQSSLSWNSWPSFEPEDFRFNSLPNIDVWVAYDEHIISGSGYLHGLGGNVLFFWPQKLGDPTVRLAVGSALA